jgi:hypothetical protein
MSKEELLKKMIEIEKKERELLREQKERSKREIAEKRRALLRMCRMI